MIEAWFEGWDMTGDGSAVNVPVLMPNDEIREIAGLVGMDDNDLFCIDIPSGATRYTTIKCLIPTQSLPYLFNAHLQAETAAQGGIPFHWRDEANDDKDSVMKVWLLPPQPIFQNATKYGASSSDKQIGLVAVTAVDRRYFWSNSTYRFSYYGRHFTHDGRWVQQKYSEYQTPYQIADHLSQRLTVTATGDRSYIVMDVFKTITDADTLLQQRAWNINFNAAVNPAMGLDLLLSLLGFVLVPMQIDDDWLYVVIRIGGPSASYRSVVDCADYTDDNQLAVAGGVQPSSDPSLLSAPNYPLFQYWNGQFDLQYQKWCVQNNWDYLVQVEFPIRTTEGNSHYSNAEDMGISESWVVTPFDFFDYRATDLGISPRAQSRRKFRSLRESRPLLRSNNSSNKLLPPNVPAWDFDAYSQKVADLLKTRMQEVQYGTVAWGGWIPSYGEWQNQTHFRLTCLRYTIAVRSGQVVPITITTNEATDWLLGPDGLPTTNPREVFVGKGLAKVQRHCSGFVEIDVAPPNCRVFPAIITGAIRLQESGNGYWQWKYEWEEVERDPTTYLPVGVSLSGYERKWNKRSDVPRFATNFAEAGNVYLGSHNSGNKIAPGVLQSEYSSAFIEPAPISVGTIVMMCEHFPTGNTSGKVEGDYPDPSYFWFSMPNAVKVTCT